MDTLSLSELQNALSKEPILTMSSLHIWRKEHEKTRSLEVRTGNTSTIAMHVENIASLGTIITSLSRDNVLEKVKRLEAPLVVGYVTKLKDMVPKLLKDKIYSNLQDYSCTLEDLHDPLRTIQKV